MPHRPEAAPIYTILLPLYHEPGAVTGLADAMCGLHWPPGQLDIKILLETGDVETWEAVQSTLWPSGTECHVLPPGLPRTKPRALNYGLAHARGHFVTIYDAEDRPHPGQLYAATAAFDGANPRLACVQAPLEAYNRKANWIAGHWDLEYAQQFGLILPALAHLGLPIALGGTSNHFRADVLKAVGGWDAWNVTEDADLGMRLARAGWRTGVIALPTYEEAPEKLPIWTAQRSRWIKGFCQTLLVLMRRPRTVMSEMGIGGFLVAQATLAGAIFSAFLHGPLMVICGLCLLLPGLNLPFPAIGLILLASIVNIVGAFWAPGKVGIWRLWLILTFWLYWPLHTPAALRAMRELRANPHFWAKTPHGLTKVALELTLPAAAE